METTRIPGTTESTLPDLRVRSPQKEGVKERFSDSDGGIDVTSLPVVGAPVKRALKSRLFQFSLILPNQIVFWLVVFSGFFWTVDPTHNFGTVLTWYIWFAVVCAMMVGVGRGWCVMCPFGGFAEWIQRKTLWKRTQKSLGLGWKMPEWAASYGLVISAIVFIGLTWAEEYFNIAGPGRPIMTSFMILGIVGAATATFILFERRTFCRYMCPLSSVIGSVGSTGMVSGFRPKDRDKCLNCPTKECMRGGKDGYGCPWYTWPASQDTNTYCGLCTECYKACPYDNVGVSVQKPLTSVVAPKRKRMEIAWVVALLFGLVIYQQWNALSSYASFEGWLNTHMHFPHYPNPLAYLGVIALITVMLAGLVFLFSRALAFKTRIARSFSGWFAPLMYGLIPLMGADYLARQLPKFFNHAVSILGVLRLGDRFYDYQVLTAGWLVRAQYITMAVGILGALYATWKIGGKDLQQLTSHKKLARVIPSIAILLLGVGLIALYVAMHGAE